MKRILWMVLFASVLTFGGVEAMILSAPSQAGCGGGCGLKPLKPLPPLGCKDLVAVCRCDSKGCNCRWEWECVAND